MATYVDEGIVLRRVDYGESDRVLTVLTRGFDVAQGLASPVSRSRLAQPFYR